MENDENITPWNSNNSIMNKNKKNLYNDKTPCKYLNECLCGVFMLSLAY